MTYHPSRKDTDHGIDWTLVIGGILFLVIGWLLIMAVMAACCLN
jgi:uncharacterized integral membrane protein